MLKRILSLMEDQGFDEDSPMKMWEVNSAFDNIISGEGSKRQFPRNITNMIWTETPKNEDNQVVLAQFLQNMEKQNKLRHLLPQSYIHDDATDMSQLQKIQTQRLPQTQQQGMQFPTQYKPQQAEQQPTKQQDNQQQNNSSLTQLHPNISQQTFPEPQIQQYSERQSVEVRNVNYNDSVSHNINGTIAESEGNFESMIGRNSLVREAGGERNDSKQGESKDAHKSNDNQSQQVQSAKNEKINQSLTLGPTDTKASLQNKKSYSKLENQLEYVQESQEPIVIEKVIKSQIEPNLQKKEKKLIKDKKKYSEIAQNSNPRKGQQPSELTKPFLQHDHQMTEQQRQQHLTRGIPRPQLKNKSGIKSKPLPNKQSLLNDRLQQSQQHLETDKLLGKKQKKKCINKKWFIPMFLFVLGLVVFMSSFIIHAQLKKLAAQQVVLGPDTENIWAHFPGDTKTEIDRNWTFFTLKNPDQFLFYNEKPQFREIKGFKIIQLQDYLNITYIEDGNRVQMIDWLHFSEQPETRNLDQKVQILNIGGLAYWYNIKVARPTIILQQGLGLLFKTLETSIIENIYAQAINVQFLPEWSDDVYAEIFAPIEVSFEEAWFVWSDPAYGMGNQDNLKYWIEAMGSSSDYQSETVSQQANFLMDYFTLSVSQMKFITDKFTQFIDFATSSVLQNSYCVNQAQCTGRYLAYQQFSTSYVTRNPPPGKPIQPNDTICLSNSTCKGYFPELSAFYKNVYLDRHPEADSTLEFDPEWMRRLVNYNESIVEGLDYNTAQNCLFHIGNLDALWENGTLYQKTVQETQLLGDFMQTKMIQNQYLQNIKIRFGLPTLNHTQVFWSWIKYLNNELILQNNTNEQLGMTNLFANGLYQGFTYLQDNLQTHLLTELIFYDLQNQPIGDCATFIKESFELTNNQTASNICNKYGQKITKQLVKNLLTICTNQFKQGWNELRNGYKLSLFELGRLCEYDAQNPDSFGYWLHMRRKYLNDHYNCEITPKEYCSDYELAAIQWTSSKVTLNPPPELKFSPNHTYKAWDKNASRFQYRFYRSKYPEDDTFPDITTREAYGLLNFDNWFSAPVVLKEFTNATYDVKLKAYMRYVALEVGLNGLTMERTARELIFGYEDEILQQVKNAYPPFGGDPSTPSLIAFNDPNITKQQATNTLEWSTGKQNASLVSQYRKINGLQYLTIEKDFFNGNLTQAQLLSPWEGQDYVYGTSAKQFAPNQFDQPNISLYVPNIQRYGSGVIDDTSTEERFGFEVEVGYLGESIYESTSQSDYNKKYYQSFYAMFNETSVVGFPLFVTKNHFMNVSDNWTSLVEIWNQNSTIHYVNVSQYDDSFVVVQPYTGLSFQSTIYLQSNYHHAPDSLLNFYSEAMLPVFSLARSGNITESVVNDLLGPLKMGIAVVRWSKIVGIVVIVVSCLVCGYVYYRKKKEDTKKARENNSEDEEGNDDEKKEKREKREKKEKKKKEKEEKRQINSSQLGISLQPMSSAEKLTLNKQQYVPPAVVEQQIQ